MPDPPTIPRRPSKDSRKRFAYVAVLLLLLLPATWLVRELQVARVQEDGVERTRAAATEALDRIERHFAAMQEELVERAEDVASTDVVVEGLRARSRTSGMEGQEAVVRYFADLDVPYGLSVELYDATRELVAWNGFSMPQAAPLPTAGDRADVRTAVATDDGRRQALVVWFRVRSGQRTLGFVRTMRLVGYDAPVRNEYIRDISLVSQWQRLTQRPVAFTLDVERPPSHHSRLLRGVDGTTLGVVAISAPTVNELAAAEVARYDHVLVFWTVLLLLWLMGGVWYAYRRSYDEMTARPSGMPLQRAALGFLGAAVFWWLIRFALLMLDVPGRWQQPREPLAPLFDPIHFASGFGAGLLRSTGDFLLTALFFLVFAAAFIELARPVGERVAARIRRSERFRPTAGSHPRSPWITAGYVAAGTTLVLGLTLVLALVARHVVADSTFDFFTRQGLIPDPLLLIICCTLLLAAMGTLLVSVAVVWLTAGAVLAPTVRVAWERRFRLTTALGAAAPFVILYALTPLASVLAWPVALSVVFAAVALAVFGVLRSAPIAELFALRSLLPAVFFVTVLVYPMLYAGMDANRRIQMTDAAETFSDGRDPRVQFAVEQLLRRLRTDENVQSGLAFGEGAALDSLTASAFRGSLLSSLPAYSVDITYFGGDGRAVGRFYDTGQMLDAGAIPQLVPLSEHILHMMYEEGADDVFVATVTGTREPERLQFGGIAPVIAAPDTVGWITIQAAPDVVPSDAGTPFPSVLVPAGAYDDLFATLSIAEFRDGLLVRSMGRDFGRYRLPEDVVQALAAEPSVWRSDVVEEREYRTFYLRRDVEPRPERAAAMLPATITSVVAVRAPSVTTFDHLYFLLRLTLAGLLIGLPLYLFGLYKRRREGMLPAERVRFRDKVLNAFVGVGIISVAAVGVVGFEVVTTENEQAVQSWLRQHLERVEETLALDAGSEEMPYSVLDDLPADSLAARSGLDLNVYAGNRLVDLSRPQLIQERLIDERLPIEAYEALYFDGLRFVYTNEQVGTFRYTTGFRALPDEQGSPRYIVSVPTLPEQERIEEERARTIAYLFGSLLLLVIVVMLTAFFLANAISRPIARLRSGLEAVAAGHFERMLPSDSRDEIGELVDTFNEMQGQLAESRRKLAQQERQLAWREMARQVAHEIKNPLTPMKLSVQHLRRAFDHRAEDEASGKPFRKLFDQITGTLIEQIDTLARIANEFHSFARMPSRILEHLDLNAVVEEAVSLMQEESGARIEMKLSGTPLIVEADREELRRDYINLIKNALQAIPEEEHGVVEVTTDRRIDPSGTWAYGAVRDNGIGIEEDVRAHIFEPNFSTKTSGTGLGLAIVKKSVEELKGDVGFETELGQGTTFWIKLPLDEAT